MKFSFIFLNLLYFLNSFQSSEAAEKCDIGRKRCNNGQCINLSSWCDGIIDCADGSDEIIKICENQRYPNYGYHNCISNKIECDNNNNCIINCIRFEPEIIEPKCYVPIDNFLTLVDVADNTTLYPNTNVKSLISIVYVCTKGSILISETTTNFCIEDEWLYEHPKCVKPCPPLEGHTIKPFCNLDGVGVQCNKPVRPGTTAKITCEVIYEKPKDRRVNEDLLCQDDGDWDYTPFKCDQTCGVIDTKIPFSVNSKITHVHSVPWNVGIYKKNKDGKFEHICGGTLIRSKIIISAAHCFWDSTIEKLFDKSDYVITVGKFYRDFYATNETEVIQTKTISKIDIPITFNGGYSDYANDIAVLTLNDHIKFNNYVRPVCLTWKGGYEQYVNSGTYGVVAGWGITDGGEYSPDLRSVELETIDYDTCTKRKLKPTDKISNGKFCVENSEGKNVCQGDNGGGFVVAENINNVQYFHLWGVSSNAIISQVVDDTVQCNSNFIATFTNVQYYESLVTKAIKNAYQSI